MIRHTQGDKLMDELGKDAKAVADIITGSRITSDISKSRQKWNECGIEEKVERLRRAVNDLRWAVNAARRQSRDFEHHQHDAKGEIVVPLHTKYSEDEGSCFDSLA